MKNRSVLRLCVLVPALAFAILAPRSAVSLGGGEATNYVDGICYWRCYSGSVGSAPASSGRKCLDLCRDACFGTCIAMY